MAVLDPAVLPHAATVLRTNLDQLLGRALGGGWSPEELVELVRRQSGGQHVGALVAVIERSSGATGVSASQQRALSEQVGLPRPPDLQTQDGIACALWLIALLAILPTSEAMRPAPGPTPERESRPEDRKLATVRALLAKAESTVHDDEAEALTTKAQELISRYALDRLLEEESGHQRGPADVALRRIWLDAPYVSAKATLVAAVAMANRCRAVAVDRLGFSAVLGDPHDLEVVELLATSLLVQATRRCSATGARPGTDARPPGRSGTRS
ncbi:DUF2786 domain-containing protein [Auraticoccus monumenti]|uniref:DUF2786 domain-containing protein n=1 Tax=Auraticoccus monumenti TaxID=675864 RepID=UPI000AC106CF|nr:DUF2786 domain-containing protein [Auraticoccus monumenti]